MEIPSAYVEWRESLGASDISFGCGGIYLVAVQELDAYQVGYSRSPDGVSLVGEGTGWWKSSWVAIGHETTLGDPIILDTAALRVMTAPHGEGTWSPDVIATSLGGFGAALAVLQKASSGREDPAKLEANPLSPNERQAAIDEILRANPTMEPSFWELLLEADTDGI